MSAFAVVQGSSKGIGLAITRALLARTKLNVVATTSSDPRTARENALKDHGKDVADRLTTLEMDVTREDSIREAHEKLKEQYGSNMQLLVNVSGMLHAEKSLSEIDPETFLQTFKVNTLGHVLVYKHLLSLIPSPRTREKEGSSDNLSDGILPRDKSMLVSFSARVGSIADNERGGWYSYRSTKAATNQVIRTLSHEVNMRKIGASAFAYHPGTVKTELSEPYVGSKEPDPESGLHTPDVAAEKFIDVLKGGVPNGAFVDWKGEKVPW